MDKIELSIVMPCLNESETLATCIQKAQAFLDNHAIDGEIIVADNGSTDGSQDIARKHDVKLVDIPIKGYGVALMGGIQAANGIYVIIGDADDSYDFSDLTSFVEKLREGYELVMGNRFQGGVKSGAMPFLHYYLGNPLLSFLGRLFFRSPIGDFHCGLRGFRRDSILGLNLRTTGMEFASEMIVKSTLYNLKMTEVPTTLYPDGRSRPPHLQTWSDGWRHLRFLLLYSPRWLFLYPGILMACIGLAVSIWLLPNPRPFAGMVLDIGTLLYAASLLFIGVQWISFAIYTKIFGISEGLLPNDSRFENNLRVVTLERVLLLGLMLIIGGLAISFGAISYWNSQALGPLNPSISMRLIIPGGLMVVLGSQIILFGFFKDILGLPRR